MIIQRVIKGISNLSQTDAVATIRTGIVCNWWRKVGVLPRIEVPLRLTERNLNWHQNHYDEADPDEGGEVFRLHTPFISTTAGSVQRDFLSGTNTLVPAWQVALRFATDGWRTDGCLFYCYVLVSGKRAVRHEAFAEEIRELNVYTGYSPYQPEGEVTAKIMIPPTQIEKVEFWSRDEALRAARSGVLPAPTTSLPNPLFVDPAQYSNVRGLLE